MDIVLSEIFIYPVKSLGGISVATCRVLAEGLEHDRRWMLVDANGRFLSQRERPELALLKVQHDGDRMLVSHSHSGERFALDMHQRSGQITVSIWNDQVQASGVSTVADQWFSDMLSMKCRLVQVRADTDRQVDRNYAERGMFVRFPDAFPVLLIGQGSLDDLNQRLETAVPVDRFRPNLVLRGAEPYAEDGWKRFGLGSALFEVARPCARCVVITTDQQSAEKSAEPLRTLSVYRSRENKVLFGQNTLVISEGMIRTGDKLRLTS
jgi:uncharacterized protein YcbX